MYSKMILQLVFWISAGGILYVDLSGKVSISVAEFPKSQQLGGIDKYVG